mgnify:CR=1 FL=1
MKNDSPLILSISPVAISWPTRLLIFVIFPIPIVQKMLSEIFKKSVRKYLKYLLQRYAASKSQINKLKNLKQTLKKMSEEKRCNKYCKNALK